MAKYCASCGGELQPAAKFCGSCGYAVPPEIHNCPTCGQEWDGKPAKNKVENNRPAVTKSIQVLTKPITTSTVVAHNTTAKIQPVYGPLYVEGKDCPNCGSVNMANKTCKTCESEN